MANSATPTDATSRFSTNPQKKTISPTAVTNGQHVGGGGTSGRGMYEPFRSCAGSAGETFDRPSSIDDGSDMLISIVAFVYRIITGDGFAVAMPDSIASDDGSYHAPSFRRIAAA